MADADYSYVGDAVVNPGYAASGSFDFDAHYEFLDVPEDEGAPALVSSPVPPRTGRGGLSFVLD